MEWKACVEYGEEIEFAFTVAGFFDRSTDGLFSPELPRSIDVPLPVGIHGPFKAVGQSGEVVVGYVDATTSKLFLVTLLVRPQCPVPGATL
jgi:hypothetical protein